MADERQNDPGSGDGGVFGKLPSARPGMRSPRRRSEGEKTRDAETVSPDVRPPDTGGRGSTPSPATQPSDPRERAAASSPPTEPTAAEGPEAPEGRDGPGVEDLAWAGITVAAEAATLGVRLLSRAVEVVRRPADHR